MCQNCVTFPVISLNTGVVISPGLGIFMPFGIVFPTRGAPTYIMLVVSSGTRMIPKLPLKTISKCKGSSVSFQLKSAPRRPCPRSMELPASFHFWELGLTQTQSSNSQQYSWHSLPSSAEVQPSLVGITKSRTARPKDSTVAGGTLSQRAYRILQVSDIQYSDFAGFELALSN